MELIQTKTKLQMLLMEQQQAQVHAHQITGDYILKWGGGLKSKYKYHYIGKKVSNLFNIHEFVHETVCTTDIGRKVITLSF